LRAGGRRGGREACQLGVQAYCPCMRLDDPHYTIHVPKGADEAAAARDFTALAGKWDCTATCTRGALWTRSRGRELRFKIEGDPDGVRDFRSLFYLNIA